MFGQRITYEDVSNAANYIWLNEKRTPTLQRVRSAIGRGSFTTISGHLKVWYLENKIGRELSGDSKNMLRKIQCLNKKANHELIVIKWITENTGAHADEFLCQKCFNVFDIEEIKSIRKFYDNN